MAEQGTLDVSKDLQERTDPKPVDKLLMVNGETKELQDISIEKLGDQVQVIRIPVFTNDLSDI